MGLRRFFRRMSETDEERLSRETGSWTGAISGTTPIASVPSRTRVRVAGVVRRITIKAGEEILEAVLWDGTGEIAAVWTGQSAIPGLRLGTRLVLEGMAGEERGRVRIVNPRYEFAST